MVYVWSKSTPPTVTTITWSMFRVTTSTWSMFRVKAHLRQSHLGATLPLFHPVGQPLLTLLDLLLAEGQVDGGIVLGATVLERDPVSVHVGEILFGLFGRAGSQP
jgi:hypothetical protein